MFSFWSILIVAASFEKISAHGKRIHYFSISHSVISNRLAEESLLTYALLTLTLIIEVLFVCVRFSLQTSQKRHSALTIVQHANHVLSAVPLDCDSPYCMQLPRTMVGSIPRTSVIVVVVFFFFSSHYLLDIVRGKRWFHLRARRHLARAQACLSATRPIQSDEKAELNLFPQQLGAEFPLQPRTAHRSDGRRGQMAMRSLSIENARRLSYLQCGFERGILLRSGHETSHASL